MTVRKRRSPKASEVSIEDIDRMSNADLDDYVETINNSTLLLNRVRRRLIEYGSIEVEALRHAPQFTKNHSGKDVLDSLRTLERERLKLAMQIIKDVRSYRKPK